MIIMQISKDIYIKDSEVEFQPVRGSGPGGQKINKTSSAVQLFFDISSSSLPENYKEKLLSLNDRRITGEGVVVIKSGRYRSQQKNKQDAMNRLIRLIISAAYEPQARKPTRPSRSARTRRLAQKARQSRVKEMRKPVVPEE